MTNGKEDDRLYPFTYSVYLFSCFPQFPEKGAPVNTVNHDRQAYEQEKRKKKVKHTVSFLPQGAGTRVI
jgi:hypothetical protein